MAEKKYSQLEKLRISAFYNRLIDKGVKHSEARKESVRLYEEQKARLSL
jgi:hypothetical protein